MGNDNLWDAGAVQSMTPVTRLDRFGQAVSCLQPTDAVGLCWRFFAPRQRLKFAVNLAARVLNNFPQGRANFPEPLDLLHALALCYIDKDRGGRLYRWAHWQLDSMGLPWLKYVFFRLVGREHFGPLAGLASRPGWTPSTVTIHRQGDGGNGTDSAGTAEDLEFSDDSDGLDEAFAAAMPQALQLTRVAVNECAACNGFGANSDKADQVFIGLYGEAQTPAAVVRKTGARRAFVKLMEDVVWLDSTLRQHCRPATIDAIVNAISFRARK